MKIFSRHPRGRPSMRTWRRRAFRSGQTLPRPAWPRPDATCHRAPRFLAPKRGVRRQANSPYIDNLIGGFKHFLFSIISGIILPIDEYFSRWLKPPTSNLTLNSIIIPYINIHMGNSPIIDIHYISTMWAPPVISWFRFAPVTSSL